MTCPFRARNGSGAHRRRAEGQWRHGTATLTKVIYVIGTLEYQLEGRSARRTQTRASAVLCRQIALAHMAHNPGTTRRCRTRDLSSSDKGKPLLRLLPMQAGGANLTSS